MTEQQMSFQSNEKKYVDPVEPLERCIKSILIGGAVGLVHGAVDSFEFGENMHPYIHHALNYVTPVASSYYVASSQVRAELSGKIVGGTITAALVGAVQTIAYFSSKSATELAKNIIN